MRTLFIIILLSIGTLVFSQRENTLPLKALSSATDSIRVVIDNQSSIMLRSVLQGAIYDSLATHTDTLQALRADIDAGGSADLSDSITAHRLELNDLHDSIADHRIDIDANLDSIADHRIELDNLHDSISDHRTDIDANAATGVTNASNISSNSVFIGVNTADILSLEDSITKHTDTLQVHQGQIAALQAGGVSADSSWVSSAADTVYVGQIRDGTHFKRGDDEELIININSASSVSITNGGFSTGSGRNLIVNEAIVQIVISHSLTDGAPTDAQIDAATGTTPAAVGSGWKRLILDSDGSALMYIIISDGSNWQYTVMTIAL